MRQSARAMGLGKRRARFFVQPSIISEVVRYIWVERASGA